MPYNPTTVANYFISKYARVGSLTPMKVVQLTYIAYGWYLALTEKTEKLTDEHPAAWDFGPVFPSLFNSLAEYGKKYITGVLPNAVGNNKIADLDKKFLDVIWNKYGRYDGAYLNAITGQENTPYEKVYRAGYNLTIPDDDLYAFYRGHMEKVPAN
ncbi:Panacea domain-containing protein [uncultured Chitinophaga sp.]|uniref:Panacea domain-containing protein n=1 Tax=uncultured Chitinophaga sp. TaxID=339340 RepID=UPI0025F10C10|nr:type II toxin-antitoxin system antitoxin SocA domain-containing protein [uncultured Chitinophaga sp.]